MNIVSDNKINLKIGDVDIQATSLQGVFPSSVSYQDLIKVFGKPGRIESVHGKTQVQWCGTIDGLVFLVYDYKSDLCPEAICEWHVGGRDQHVVDLLVSLLKNRI
jgi:hypothetical protein